MEQPFPDKIEMLFSKREHRTKRTRRFDMFYLSDRTQISGENASEGDSTDDDQRTENFFPKIAIQTLEVKCSYYFRTEGVLVYSAVLDGDYASDVRTHRGRSIVVFQHQVDKFSARDGRRESGAL